jgi:hypothetical protein
VDLEACKGVRSTIIVSSPSGYIEEWRIECRSGVFCLGVDGILV